MAVNKSLHLKQIDYSLDDILKQAPKPKNKETKVVKRKRIGKCGEVFIERRIVSDFFNCSYEPMWTSLSLSLSKEDPNTTSSNSMTMKGIFIIKFF